MAEPAPQTKTLITSRPPTVCDSHVNRLPGSLFLRQHHRYRSDAVARQIAASALCGRRLGIAVQGDHDLSGAAPAISHERRDPRIGDDALGLAKPRAIAGRDLRSATELLNRLQ